MNGETVNEDRKQSGRRVDSKNFRVNESFADHDVDGGRRVGSVRFVAWGIDRNTIIVGKL